MQLVLAIREGLPAWERPAAALAEAAGGTSEQTNEQGDSNEHKIEEHRFMCHCSGHSRHCPVLLGSHVSAATFHTQCGRVSANHADRFCDAARSGCRANQGSGRL